MNSRISSIQIALNFYFYFNNLFLYNMLLNKIFKSKIKILLIKLKQVFFLQYLNIMKSFFDVQTT
jgi:hypothetical protein